MLLSKKRQIFWHLVLPICFAVQQATGFMKDWHFLAPRFALFAVFVARDKYRLHQVALAYVIEAVALTVMAWLFGRAIM